MDWKKKKGEGRGDGGNGTALLVVTGPLLVLDRNMIFLFGQIVIFGKNGILAENIGKNANYQLF